MKQTNTYIYGRHAVEEAILNTPFAIEKVFITTQNERDFSTILKQNKIPFGIFSGGRMPPGTDDSVAHQGVIAKIIPSKLVRPYKNFIESFEVNKNSLFVLLGELSDPQNVGAVIRSAVAFGASAILLPEHNQAPINGAVVKVSAGMAFKIPLVQVSNVNTVVRDLKDRGFWIYALDASSKTNIYAENFDSPTVIILGNEARGVREKTIALCDAVLKIPMSPKCESLNAAASAAIALYAWSVRHSNFFK